MKKALVTCLLLLPFTWATLAAAESLPSPTQTAVQPLDSVVAVVNKDVITQNELDTQLKAVKAQLTQQHIQMPSETQLKGQVLDHLIYEKLQLQLAERASIEADTTEINDAITRIAKRNKLTVTELKAQLTKQGQSYADYRKHIGHQIVMEKLQQIEVGKNITVTDQEINALLKDSQQQKSRNSEYHLQNILITLPDAPSPEQLQAAKQRAQQVMDTLQKGANFGETAITQSGGQQALQGGDLGWRKLAELPTVFASRVKGMKTDDIAGPMRTPNGYQIIKLTGVKQNKAQKITKAQAQQMIFQRKLNQKLQSWLQELRDTAYVKIVNE